MGEAESAADLARLAVIWGALIGIAIGWGLVTYGVDMPSVLVGVGAVVIWHTAVFYGKHFRKRKL